MADIDYSELEELTLNMEDENGVVTECELQFVFEYEDKDYGAFCEVDSDTGEFYFFVMNGKLNPWKTKNFWNSLLLFCSRLLMKK